MTCKFALHLAVSAFVVALLLAAALHGGSAVAQAGSGEISGNVPASGGFGLVVWGGGATVQLQAAADARGCALRSAWVTVEGDFVGYVYGAPDFVNAGFRARFQGLAIPAGTPLILVCNPRGIPPQVQSVIDMVTGGRLDDLERAVRLTAVPCGPQQGAGSPPPCPPGQPNGTPVDIFPVVTCQAELRPRAAVRPTLAELLPTIIRLTAVYRAPAASLHFLPVTPVPGDHVAVFSRQLPGQPNLGVGVVVEGSEVVGLVFRCGASPGEIVPSGTEPVFVPSTSVSGATGPGLSVAEAVASTLSEPLLVRGYLVVGAGAARLCEGLSQSSPPQCIGASLAVEGLRDWHAEGLREAAGIRWSEQPLKLLGEVREGTLRVSAMASA